MLNKHFLIHILIKFYMLLNYIQNMYILNILLTKCKSYETFLTVRNLISTNYRRK